MNATSPHSFAFRTPRLRMRTLGACDAELYCSLFTDAEAMCFIGPTLTRERAARNFNKALEAMRRQPATELIFAIHADATEWATEWPIGMCSIQHIVRAERRAEVGLMLSSEARNRGYATEALTALVAQAFALLPVDEIITQFQADHIAAKRLVERVGFRSRECGLSSSTVAKLTWSIHRHSASGTRCK